MASTYKSLPIPQVSVGSVQVTDGVDTLLVNPDGSINVAGISVSDVNATIVGVNEFEYGEALALASGGSATAVSRFFATEYKLRRVSCTGENIAVYTVRFSGAPVDKKRSTYTNFNCEFDYETGITIPAGTTVTVLVENSGTTSADFSAQLLFSAI